MGRRAATRRGANTWLNSSAAASPSNSTGPLYTSATGVWRSRVRRVASARTLSARWSRPGRSVGAPPYSVTTSPRGMPSTACVAAWMRSTSQGDDRVNAEPSLFR